MVLPDYYDLVPKLELPIRGKTYVIPTMPAKDVIRWKVYAAKYRAGEEMAESEKVKDAEFFAMILGPVLDEMIADGVPSQVIAHAAKTALADAESGRDIAEAVWGQTDPKAPTDAVPSKGSTRSRSTGAASTTKRPARTSGTRTPQK